MLIAIIRPSVRPNQPAQPPPPSYPFETPSNRQTIDSDIENSAENKRWSNTQASKTPTRRPQNRTINPHIRRSNSISGRSTLLSRDSLSTIGPDDYADPGAYKVVIKHGIAQPDPREDPRSGALDVQIPHYRLGTPRFSTRGTPFLNSTIYSRNSAATDLDLPNPPTQEFESFRPLPTDPPILTHPDNLHNKALPPTPVSKGVPIRMPITTIAPVFHQAREPIGPAIYDAIAARPDDPAIVRYAMSNREISAASPARLITQITSKNFLDYELLSDFFLTVRAYLSTNDLLEYLLARFQWAIDRLDDDGRVIRVRAFAAIRHWILNYFSYDFLMDRALRVKFCDRLNLLTRHVRAGGHEASDLKLIIDLKKCWNGRCNTFWDHTSDEAEVRVEVDIKPGGVIGSRDSQLTHPNDPWVHLQTSSSQQMEQEKSVALSNWVDSVIEAEVEEKTKKERQNSGTSPISPGSQLSEQSSIPANSCSVPTRNFKAFAHAARNPGPHPMPINIPSSMPMAVRRACPPAPSSQSKEKMRGKGDHQRSGSLSDALRDKRTSLGAIQEGKATEPAVTSTFSGNLIRGAVFPPGSPFIDNLTEQGSGSSMKNNKSQYQNVPQEKMGERPMSPGVKNLLGNLRRAWSRQQGPASPASSTPSLIPPAPFVLEAKYSGLPMHIAYKIEGFGDQHHQLEALKKNARIDLLCADVTDMFERALPPDGKAVSAKPSNSRMTQATEPDRHSPDSWQHIPSPREKLSRNHSEFTSGSRSIVIVDDTSSEPPVPNIPATYSKPVSSYNPSEVAVTIGEITEPVPAFPRQYNHVEGDTPSSHLLPDFTHPQPGPNSSPATHSSKQRPQVAPTKSYRSDRSNSVSLRKYASYQSGIGRQSFDTTRGSVIRSPEKPMPAGKGLKRRPGGDLRANENVHDMEIRHRRGSTGSIATFTESLHDSAVMLRRVPAAVPKPPSAGTLGRASTPVVRRSISLVNPRTSHKELRRSFELAVAQFARIPDDERGDLETTLMKLEGKFSKSPTTSSDGPSSQGSATRRPPQAQSKPRKAEKGGNAGKDALTTPTATTSKPLPNNASDKAIPSLYRASEESYNPVPLAERGAAKGQAQPSEVISDGSNQSNVTIPQPLFSPKPSKHDGSSTLSDRTSELGSTKIRRGRFRSSIPTMTTDSFLLDEDEFLSDMSSDLSSDDYDDDSDTNSVLEDAFGSSAQVMHPPPPAAQSPAAPQKTSLNSGYLPSPPMTTENDVSISSDVRRQQDERKPPTPEPSPVSRMTEASTRSRAPTEVDNCVLKPFANKLHRFPPRRHLPFILRFDDDVLAQQFTLIERDALIEINWQDLIDLRWQTQPSAAQNWVEYLRFAEANGIDLTIARSNLVVKWALSEIVLTYNVEERALTIMKLIRVAQHARRYHNYATLLQLTLALTSMDCTRLKKTWSHVPEAERSAMKEMESLVSPIRNFYNLRAELDKADIDDGCIPVVGTFPPFLFPFAPFLTHILSLSGH